jgi:hypothetical protein
MCWRAVNLAVVAIWPVSDGPRWIGLLTRRRVDRSAGMLNETWKEQYNRMQRSFAVLNQKNQERGVMEARDVLYHFCSDAFHLRDWIAASIGTDEATTKAFAQQLANEVIFPSPELSACCDIANGFKHHVLHRRSYVTRTNQGHAKVIEQAISIYTKVIIEDPVSRTADILHTDGTLETNVPLDSEAFAAATSEAGWVQDTFTIDINGQERDAHDVATKAVAAWDQWIQGTSPIAAQLR